MQGSANVIYTDPQGKDHRVHELRSGDACGISDLFFVEGYEYFGRIEATDYGMPLKCLVIENPDTVFELHERSDLKT